MDNKDFLIEFIELYRSYPCLWKVKSQDYSNKLKKNQAYDVLAKNLNVALSRSCGEIAFLHNESFLFINGVTIDSNSKYVDSSILK